MIRASILRCVIKLNLSGKWECGDTSDDAIRSSGAQDFVNREELSGEKSDKQLIELDPPSPLNDVRADSRGMNHKK
jgi:hypothetical protein